MTIFDQQYCHYFTYYNKRLLFCQTYAQQMKCLLAATSQSSIDMVKLLRVYGECLGVERR